MTLVRGRAKMQFRAPTSPAMSDRRPTTADGAGDPRDVPVRSAAGLVIGLAVVAGLLAAVVGAGWAAYLLRGRPPARPTAPVAAAPAREVPVQAPPAGGEPAPVAAAPAAAAIAAPAPPVAITSDPAELCKAFRLDPVDADRRYRGQVVEVAVAIGKSPGLNPGARPFAVLAAGGKDIIAAYFLDAQAERVAALRKGQAVRVRGTVTKAVVDRADSSVTVTLEGCALLDGLPKEPARPPE